MKIIFKWSGAIISEKPSILMGKVTTIQQDNSRITYHLYGKCEVGNCGPFTVISIK